MAADLVSAQLGGIIIESALFGIYFSLFLGCVYVLVFKNKRKDGRVNWILLIASVLLFISIFAVSYLQNGSNVTDIH